MPPKRAFIPALSYHALTPLYDLVARLVIAERKFKSLVLRTTDLRPAHRLLDVGCGTGTLLQLAARQKPEAELAGADADPRVLAIARRNALRHAARRQCGEVIQKGLQRVP